MIRPVLPRAPHPPFVCAALPVEYCSMCRPVAAHFNIDLESAWKEVERLLKPTWPSGTTFHSCDTCTQLYGVSFLLCPSCAAVGRTLHR